METPKIDFTIRVFVKLAQDREDRLQRGARLRKEMHKALESGENPVGYRVSWIKESSLSIIDLLSDIAKEFDRQHIDDKCSSIDLLDIVTTVFGLLKKHSQ
jgi:hypothetical protein